MLSDYEGCYAKAEVSVLFEVRVLNDDWEGASEDGTADGCLQI